MLKLNYKQYVLEIPKNIYLPSDDTYLMLDSLKLKKNKIRKKAVEIGSGSGIISLYLYDFVKEIFACDINPIVIDYLKDLKKKYSLNKLKIIKSNLFDKLNNKKFDLIVFNPPYVPSDHMPNSNSYEEISVLGGKYGNRIIKKFILELPNHINTDGECYLLVSSINKLEYIYKLLIKNNFQYKIVGEKSLFFEKLFVLKITNNL